MDSSLDLKIKKLFNDKNYNSIVLYASSVKLIKISKILALWNSR
jgi:hypothetical protein